MPVYIVRHGERLDNVVLDYAETSDTPWNPPLTDRGRQQAERTGHALRGKGIRTVYTSPYLRCVQTTEGLLRGLGEAEAAGVVVRVEAGLGEFLNEKWFPAEPDLPPATWQHLPGLDALYEHQVRGVYPETTEQLFDRYARAAQALVKAHAKDEQVVFVTHGYGVDGITRTLLEDEDYYFRNIDYCSLTSLVWQGDRYEVEDSASVDHLRRL